MTAPEISRVVIVGGDLTGWTAAAALAHGLAGTGTALTVLELQDLPNVEPAQYTTPGVFEFLAGLGIATGEIFRRTGATFRFGTGLHSVTGDGEHRIGAFGRAGASLGVVDFHQYVLSHFGERALEVINELTPAAVAARMQRFSLPEAHGAKRPPLAFGLCLNSEKLRELLRDYALLNGVRAVGGMLRKVDIDPASGTVSRLRLDDGDQLGADLFLDCSGERALLLAGALQIGRADWSRWLPASRAVAVTTKFSHEATPVHHLAAGEHGWQTRSLLQYRDAHQYLYSHLDVEDEDAVADLAARLGVEDPEAIATYHLDSGYREAAWSGNCVAVGASAGTVEPLEESAFSGVCRQLRRLLRHWPVRRLQPASARRYSAECVAEFRALRDFTILRYLAVSRWRRTPFWQRVGTIEPPESLAAKLELFRSRGRLRLDEYDPFGRDTWVAALVAAGVRPAGFDPLLARMENADLEAHFGRMRKSIIEAIEAMPPQRDYARSLGSDTPPSPNSPST